MAKWFYLACRWALVASKLWYRRIVISLIIHKITNKVSNLWTVYMDIYLFYWCILIFTHTDIHTHTYSNTHVHMQHTHTDMNTHTHTHTHAHTHTESSTSIRTYLINLYYIKCSYVKKYYFYILIFHYITYNILNIHSEQPWSFSPECLTCSECDNRFCFLCAFCCAFILSRTHD